MHDRVEQQKRKVVSSIPAQAAQNINCLVQNFRVIYICAWEHSALKLEKIDCFNLIGSVLRVGCLLLN